LNHQEAVLNHHKIYHTSCWPPFTLSSFFPPLLHSCNQQKLSMLNVFSEKKKVIKEKITIINLFVSTRKISKHPTICWGPPGTKSSMTCLEVFCVWLKFIYSSLQLIWLRRLKRLSFFYLHVAYGLSFESFDNRRLKRWCFTCIYIIKKKQPGLMWVYQVTGWPSGTTGFLRTKFLAGFFLNPAWFQPRVSRVPDRSAGPVWVLKPCVWESKSGANKYSFITCKVRCLVENAKFVSQKVFPFTDAERLKT